MTKNEIYFIIHGGLYYYEGKLRKFDAYKAEFIDPYRTFDKYDGVRIMQKRMENVTPVALTEDILLRFGFSNAKNPFAPLGKENNPDEYYLGETTNFYNIRTHEFNLCGKTFYCENVHNIQMVYRSMGMVEPFKIGR